MKKEKMKKERPGQSVLNANVSGKVMTTIIAYVIILAAGVAATLLLAEEITGRLLLSLVFIGVAFTAMFGMFILGMLDDRQNIMQNQAMTILGTLYFIVAVAATILVNILHFSTRAFVATEVIVLAFGSVGILWGLRGKQHIEES
ncbi:MAG: hypothetical protein HFI93_02875 [Lachnospiraceae bacterium]|nr:hypothetical protein [Lachnospiraceae bacterium]